MVDFHFFWNVGLLFYNRLLFCKLKKFFFAFKRLSKKGPKQVTYMFS